MRDVARRLASGQPGRLHSVGFGPNGPIARCELSIDVPEDLLGLRADASWDAVGLIFPTTSGAVSLVVDRAGNHAAAANDGCTVALLDTTDGIAGVLADIARRMLGLPTEPEAVGIEHLIVSAWLHNVLDAAADPGTAPSVASWAGIVGRHPAWRAAGSPFDADDDLGTRPDDVAAISAELAARLPWERLRNLAAAGVIAVPGLSASEAAWMDWPFFARWTLDVHRPVTELLDDLSLFLDGPLLADLRYTVQAVVWLGFAGPHTPSVTGDE
jgi:hypothetical protein